MATPPVGLVGSLWWAHFKVNCNNKGYQMKFPIVNADPLAAKASAVSIATAYKRIIPADAEIFYATVNNYNTARDSRFLRSALGPGRFATALGPPVVDAAFDTSFASIKLRLEDTNGGFVIRLINPVPDAVLTDEAVIPALTDVEATFAAADPVDGVLTDYAAQFLSFCQILTKHSVHVTTGAVPGGAFNFWPLQGAYPIGVSKKKGSRAFI